MNDLTDAIVLVAGFVVLALLLRGMNASRGLDPEDETTEPRRR